MDRVGGFTYTSYDGHASEAQWTSKLLCLSFNLLSQFTSGSHNECIRAQMSIIVREGGQIGDEGQHWDDEGCSLTGTWLQLNQHRITEFDGILTSLSYADDVSVL